MLRDLRGYVIIMRKNNRQNDALRPVSIEHGFQPHCDGSVFIKMGDTHVICAVTIEDKVPPFLKNSGQGWITAEYGMLPSSTHSRTNREAVRGRSGRTYEVQRLIGRSLRMMVDLSLLGERTLRVDCDVIRADGGTRTASITGAALAVRDAIMKMVQQGSASEPPILPVAAISAGIIDSQPLLDLDYEEDSQADTDANFVLAGDGRLIEVQCTAEGSPMEREHFDRLFDLAQKGIKELLAHWQKTG